MATKLTITIPDDLAERLDPWRERMNISRVCSEAIAKELAILADLPREVKELTDVIHRLRTEKAESNQQDYQTGFEDGMAYAHGATYDEFVIWCEPAMDEMHNLPEFANDHLNELLQEGDVLDARLYKQGWRAGMVAIWKRVKDKV